MIRTVLASLGVFMMLSMQAAMARDDFSMSPYAGISYGRTNFDMPVSGVTNGSLDEKDKGWKVFGGFDINEYLGVEASYQKFGTSNLVINANGSANIGGTPLPNTSTQAVKLGLDAKSFGLGVKVGKSFGVFRPFAKLGAHRWDADLKSSSPTIGALISSQDSGGTDFFYGLGVEVALYKSMGVQVEYERYDLGGVDVDMLSAGVRYKF